MLKEYSVTKTKIVKERYHFYIEASSEGEALLKAKEYNTTSDELEDVEDTSFTDEYEIEAI